MKRLRAMDVKDAVGAAGRAIGAILDSRHKQIVPEMLNSAGSVSAEWYIEVLWHYLAKRSLLQGLSSLDVEFKQPARLVDTQLYFSVPDSNREELVMNFHVLRRTGAEKRPLRVPVASVRIHRGVRRRRRGVAPEPPRHPYGIEVRQRNLNASKQVSWYTLVASCMDVGRRGMQFADERIDRVDERLLYIVPRFTFVPLAEAGLRDNLFIYPEFEVVRRWAKGKTSAVARVTFWAVANEEPWPIAECVVTVVRTSVVDGVRRAVDESGAPVTKSGKAKP